MIDKEKLAQVRTAVRGGVSVEDLTLNMSEDELRALRDAINEMLPLDKVASLDLEDELMQQYRVTKRLMQDISADSDVAPNQKAQVANAVVSTLGQLTKLQEDLRREQTLKIMEACLMEALKMLPDDARETFYEEYAHMAEQAGIQ